MGHNRCVHREAPHNKGDNTYGPKWFGKAPPAEAQDEPYVQIPGLREEDLGEVRRALHFRRRAAKN